MIRKMRSAFTLIELLVVIAIAAILISFLLPRIWDAVVKAQEATCRTNLKNLYAATVNYANDHGSDLPLAGSYETLNNDNGNWDEHRGWVSWIPRSGKESDWPPFGNPKSGGSGDDEEGFKSLMKMDRDITTSHLAIEKGTIWPYTGQDKKMYRCPLAAKAMTKAGDAKEFPGSKSINDSRKYLVTYAMNEFCGWEGHHRDHWTLNFPNRGKVPTNPENNDENKNLSASAVVLFAERPLGVTSSNGEQASVMYSGKSTDANNTSQAGQMLGAYHSGPSKTKMGLVVFMDGHIDKVPAQEGNKNVIWYLNRGLDPF